MNLDELQSVQNKERQSSGLQHLRASFYQDAGEFVEQLRDRRDQAAAEADDPFGSEEVRRLTDDIDTAERTVESLYERRVGKVVKVASIAAAGMPYDDDGMTVEEEQLFETLVARIEENREHVLSVLDGEAGALTCSRTESDAADTDTPPGSTPTEPDVVADEPSGVTGTVAGARAPDPTGAAGGSGAEATTTQGAEESGPPTPPANQGEGLDIGGAMGGEAPTGTTDAPDTAEMGGESAPAPTEATPEAGAGAGAGPNGSDASGDDDAVDRTVVRITGDVGDIFGVDGRTYDLSSDDVVDLPEKNAKILVGQDNAQPLE
jgi:DNA replication factor GINS